MTESSILVLARELEWLSREEAFQAHRPEAPGVAASTAALECRSALLATVDKIERELMSAVRFNPTPLLGIEYEWEESLDSLASLLSALDGLREAVIRRDPDLALRVRQFVSRLEAHLDTASPLTA
jgi:hypothetical protein